jgi:hypothetical protein
LPGFASDGAPRGVSSGSPAGDDVSWWRVERGTSPLASFFVECRLDCRSGTTGGGGGDVAGSAFCPSAETGARVRFFFGFGFGSSAADDDAPLSGPAGAAPRFGFEGSRAGNAAIAGEFTFGRGSGSCLVAGRWSRRRPEADASPSGIERPLDEDELPSCEAAFPSAGPEATLGPRGEPELELIVRLLTIQKPVMAEGLKKHRRSQ